MQRITHFLYSCSIQPIFCGLLLCRRVEGRAYAFRNSFVPAETFELSNTSF
jgi:hypothetical protein